MATLPTIPSFSYQETPTLTKMQNLSGAVSFVSGLPIMISLKTNTNQSVAANTATAVQWLVSECDSDSMHSTSTNTSRLTAVTQGYYRLHTVLALSFSASKEYQAYFRQTTGSSNPLGAGVQQTFGGDAGESPASASFSTMCVGLRSLTPCLYAGDYVEVVVQVAAAVNLVYNFGNTTFTDNAGSADGACCLYGYYDCEGP